MGLAEAAAGRELTGRFEVKGGGAQTVGAGGMVRSDASDKVNYTLALDGPMFRRWAAHLTKATRPPVRYPERNWMLSAKGTPEERAAAMKRYVESATRHFLQWVAGERDEDHAAAVMFNLNGYEYVRDAQMSSHEENDE